MKWLIKNPAPTGRRKKKWGDYHFGQALAKQLRNLDQDVETDFFGNWANKKKADVTLVLRGDFPFDITRGSFTILWVYSHPETVSIEECSQYDLVCVCSQLHAEYLQRQLTMPAVVLPQCVDTKRFYLPKNENGIRQDIVFVGNTRISRRDSVFRAIEIGLPIKIWGKGWDEFIDKRLVVSEYLENEKLPYLYQKSKATLNDHFPDMRSWGYINNRVFDALACGLPVISDYVPGLPDLFGDAVMCYRNQDEFNSCIERMLFQYPEISRAARQAGKKVAQNHSFKNRAELLLELAKQHI